LRHPIRTFTCMLLVLCCTVCGVSAQQDGPVPYTVLMDRHQYMMASQVTFTYIQEWDNDWTSLIDTAISRWNSMSFSGATYPNAKKPTFRRVTSSSANCDIVSYQAQGVSWRGQLISAYPKYGTYVHYGWTEIRLNDYYWENRSAKNQNTALHEMGHRYGLDESNTSSAVMWPQVSTIVYPQQDDKNGVSQIWYRCSQGN
jgi:hypothetical protein